MSYLHRFITTIICMGSLLSSSIIADEQKSVVEEAKDTCEDTIQSIATIDPKLDSPFFQKMTTSYPWWIHVHPDGHLENVAGEITEQDVVRVEHTADCKSTHQGEHKMKFCAAYATKDGVKLYLWGGLPAYQGDMTIHLNKDLHFSCEFSFHPPYNPSGQSTHWRITKKVMKIQSGKFDPGYRLRAWVSIEFESTTDAKERHKIEGYIKPIILSREQK